MRNTVDKYGWQCTRDPNSCAYIAPRIFQLIKQVGARRILDIGCGNGALCSHLVARGYDVVGLDTDKDGVEIARDAVPAAKFYNFGVHDDPALLLKHEDTFDTVVSTEVIEHLFAPHLLPSYARNCLKPGGHLILTTPYHGYLKNLVLSLFDKWDAHHTALWHGGHIKFWSRATLAQLLGENGFTVTSFTGVGRLPLLWKSMVLTSQLCLR